MTHEEAFQFRYQNLNQEQRTAVDTIYGPVMVIAGPGTGKTEVLSMRIANLLRSEAQVQPHEVLCLTYTEEATNAMRRRLVQVIGTAAHKVNIYTFHAFCNNIIQSHSEYFSLRSLQPITDLERTEMLHEILEALPQGHQLRRLSGNIYFDASRISRLFDLMKREHITSADMQQAVSSYVDSLPGRDKFIYKKATKEFKKGDLKKKDVEEETRRMNETLAAAELLEIYEQKKRDSGRYDFNDMIIWVLEAFEKYPFLLQSYQERYQFILVDEFQDTNGSQNDLLRMLTQFWEDPNVFVVGDDDQSIYEFQGARLRNIIDFYETHRESIRIIVLPQNYRSSQPILNKATAAIEHNKQRLIYQLEHLKLDKNIVASSPRFANGADSLLPEIKQYANILHEEADVVMQIEELQRQGVNPGDIAILYAQHKQVENITALMERKGIPYNVKRQVNILHEPLIAQLITLLGYLDKERTQPFSGEPLLFEIIHAPYYEILPADIAQLSLFMQANRTKDRALGYWRTLLQNRLQLETLPALQTVPALLRMGENIDRWLPQLHALPLPLLLEKLVYESGMMDHIVKHKDYIWQIQVLHTFFDFVKDSFARDSRLRPAGLLRMLERMELESLAVPLQKVVSHDNGVHCYTAHGAKGNEFEHVFLIGCTKNYWEAKKGGGTDYKLPDTITSTEEDTQNTYKVEVARRLFYVALTRAKKYLHISYAAADNAGKPLEASAFIDEISAPEDRVGVTLPPEEVAAHIAWAVQPVPDVRIALANHQWVDKALQQFTMSYTSLSKYLNCPLQFYFETLLKVPFLKGDALGFGSAVHYALERMYLIMQENKGEFPDKETVIAEFKKAMYREQDCFTAVQYERRTEQGITLITDYYDAHIEKLTKNVQIEYKVPRYQLDGVPVTGKIDKIELEGDNCKVVDYKTGNPDNSATAMTARPNDKEPRGGDYWRQMVFYKLILENHPDLNWKVNTGVFEYVEKSKKTNEYKTFTVPMFEEDEQAVRTQMKQAYTGIMNHDFDTGCGKEDCHWCNFARKYELIRPAVDAPVVEIDDM